MSRYHTRILDRPIACNLAALSNRTRYESLKTLVQGAISGVAELPDGFSYSLDGKSITLAELGEWIDLERQCCPFLTFELSVSGPDMLWWLTLTGPEGTKPLLAQAFSV
jgi:hypothetical protein